MTDVGDLLARLVVEAQPLEKFELAYEDLVGEAESEVCQQVLSVKLPKKGQSTLYLLRGGLTVVEDQKGRWSCYETAARVEEREYYRGWNEFIRAGWTKRVPDRAGVYPTRTRDGARARDRELKLVGGKLRDCTLGGGFQSTDRVSNWAGDWWALPYPALRGAV